MKKLFKNIDFTIPLIVLILIVIGLVMIESATYSSMNSLFENVFIKKQVLAAVIGLIVVTITLFFDYRILQDYVNIIYVLNILLLVVVLFLGRTVNGGQGWLELGPVNFQPAEITKLAIIITLADLLAQKKYEMKHIIAWIIPALYLAIPFGLIILQNDLGSALVLIAIFIGMIYMAGANLKLLVGIGVTVIGITVSWVSAHLYFDVPIFLKEYQLNRLLVLVNPQLDPLNSGYNVIQSKIAIGSGRLLGKGLFAGTQNQLNFLPERHTDFIFSVLGEELGFAGVVAVLFLYCILIWRGIRVAQEAKDEFGKFVVIGILSMFTFHILENVGMTIGIMPVTGLPLPFLSYGGSSLVTNLLAVGLIININMRRKKMLF